ncbi:hypothetical protein ACFCXF_32935 [Streptomyces virginiae]
MTRDMVLDGQLVVRDGDAERVSVAALQRWAREPGPRRRPPMASPRRL